jgi:hypothetical protein
MSYGPDYQVLHRQAAGYIDRLLTGAIAKAIVETSVKVRQNLEKFVWSSREK